MLQHINSVVFFVADIHAAAQWYADIFQTIVQYENKRFAFVQTPNVVLGFHPIDSKSPGGVGGVTVYWRVKQLNEVMADLIARGATRQRGPYVTENNESTAIVIDPFGNPIGLSSFGA